MIQLCRTKRMAMVCVLALICIMFTVLVSACSSSSGDDADGFVPEVPGLEGVPATLLTPLYREAVQVSVDKDKMILSGMVLDLSFEYKNLPGYIVEYSDGYSYHLLDKAPYVLSSSSSKLKNYLVSRGVKLVTTSNETSVFGEEYHMTCRVSVEGLVTQNGVLIVSPQSITLKVNGATTFNTNFFDTRLTLLDNGFMFEDSGNSLVVVFNDANQCTKFSQLFKFSYAGLGDELEYSLESKESDVKLYLNLSGYKIDYGSGTERIDENEISFSGYNSMDNTIEFLIKDKRVVFPVSPALLSILYNNMHKG